MLPIHDQYGYMIKAILLVMYDKMLTTHDKLGYMNKAIL
jgi:hypothetical protein